MYRKNRRTTRILPPWRFGDMFYLVLMGTVVVVAILVTLLVRFLR